MTKPSGQRFPCLNHNVVVTPISGQAVPRQISVQENETQIVNALIVFAMLKLLGIVFRSAPPLRVTSALMKLPHHARQEAARPIGPQLAVVSPLPTNTVDGKIIRVLFDEAIHLLFGKFKCTCVTDSTLFISHFLLSPNGYSLASCWLSLDQES